MWLVVACNFIGQGSASRDPYDQLQMLLNSGEGLDALYSTILNSHCDDNGRTARIRFLELVLSVRDSLPLSSLLELVPPEYFTLRTHLLPELKQLSSMLCGVHMDTPGTPVTPRHSSLVEFLRNSSRSGVFYIDLERTSNLRTLCNTINPSNLAVHDTQRASAYEIEMFVHQALRSLGPSASANRYFLAQLVGGSLNWAIAACWIVMNTADSASGRHNQLRLLLTSDTGMDAFYMLLSEQCSDGGQFHFKALMTLFGTLLAVRAPLPLRDLLDLVPSIQFGSYKSDLFTKLHPLYSTVKGLDSCRSSFCDFLRDQRRSGRFHVNAAMVNTIHICLAEGCIDMMRRQLRFNIADLPTSFLQNQDIPDLQQRNEAKIHPLLSYSCQFWPLHTSIAVQQGTPISQLARSLKSWALEWLEVMSLIQSSPELALAPLNNLTVCDFL